MALIVAYDRARAIGTEGRLPWHLPDDLKRFKALTLGHTIVMGRKTFESIGRPLPGRRNFVLSTNPEWTAPGVSCCRDLDQVLESHLDGLLWVIGGGQIYAAALPVVTRIEATEVDVRVDAADAWFPAIDASQWRMESRDHHPGDATHAHAFDFVRWARI
jgi:dihydrofolate reductase